MATRGPSAFRDLVVALAVVGGLLAGLWVYTGNWPPLVIIESGSMMHPDGEVPYGRVGTIDPGDLVFVKSVDDMSDIEFWVDGIDETGNVKEDATTRYGKPGDVIVYRRNGVEGQTPIIHRAITWVTVTETPAGREYDVHWKNGVTLHFGPAGIYLPEIGLGNSPTDGYRPLNGGIITKGDNVDTNARADQHNDVISRIIQVDWVEGKARGELPWFGLLKLMVGSKFNQERPPSHWVRVVNAYAPADLWACLAALIAAIILIPLSFDVYRLVQKEKERRQDEAIREARERMRQQELDGPPGGPAPGAAEAAHLPPGPQTLRAEPPPSPYAAPAPEPTPTPTQAAAAPPLAAPASKMQRTACPGCRTAFTFERHLYAPTPIACPSCGRGTTLPAIERAPAAEPEPQAAPVAALQPAPAHAPAPQPAPAPAPTPAPAAVIVPAPAVAAPPAPTPAPEPAALPQRTTCPGCRTAFTFQRLQFAPTTIACPACGRGGKLPPLSPARP